MNLSFSAEQDELRASLRGFFAAKAPIERARHLAETGSGIDGEVWAQMTTQLGLHGIAIPEDFGGSGFTAVELGIVFEEMGRVLLVSPFFSTIGLAANILLECDDLDAKTELLPRLADGTTIATLALVEADGRFSPNAVQARAEPSADGWRLTGEKLFVTDGTLADLLLVVARTEAGVSLFAVEASSAASSGSAGITRAAMAALDSTRPLARITFADTPARLIGIDGKTGPNLAAGLDRAVAAIAAEHVGGAQRCLDMAVDYAKIRVQFERPIGSFQAIKHKCADMLVRLEAARSTAYYAAWSIADGSDEIALAAALAGAYCPDAYFDIAAENIQIHGGIGYTWEHDAHLYLRRAKAAQALFRSPDSHRDRVADLVGISAGGHPPSTGRSDRA